MTITTTIEPDDGERGRTYKQQSANSPDRDVDELAGRGSAKAAEAVEDDARGDERGGLGAQDGRAE